MPPLSTESWLLRRWVRLQLELSCPGVAGSCCQVQQCIVESSVLHPLTWAGGWVESGSWCWLCWVEAGSQGPGGHDRELEMWPGAGWLGRDIVSISSMFVRAGNDASRSLKFRFQL